MIRFLDWSNLALDRGSGGETVVSVAMNLPGSVKCWEFLD